jgi:hypothetical protein
MWFLDDSVVSRVATFIPGDCSRGQWQPQRLGFDKAAPLDSRRVSIPPDIVVWQCRLADSVLLAMASWRADTVDSVVISFHFVYCSSEFSLDAT